MENPEQYLKKTGIKVQMVIQSHLSDVPFEMSSNQNTAEVRINFVKYLVGSFTNLDLRIDVDKVWEQFLEDYPSQKAKLEGVVGKWQRSLVTNAPVQGEYADKMRRKMEKHAKFIARYGSSEQELKDTLNDPKSK